MKDSGWLTVSFPVSGIPIYIIYAYATWILWEWKHGGVIKRFKLVTFGTSSMRSPAVCTPWVGTDFLVEFPTEVGFPPFTFHKTWSAIVQCQGFFWCNGKKSDFSEMLISLNFSKSHLIWFTSIITFLGHQNPSSLSATRKSPLLGLCST